MSLATSDSVITLIRFCIHPFFKRRRRKIRKIAKFFSVFALVLAFSMLFTAPASATIVLNLPSYPVTISAVPFASGPEHLWPGTITVSGITGNYHVTNGEYTGWCAELNEWINAGQTYTATLVSSLTLPTPWDKINYLLNKVSSFTMDVQAAIWLLLGTPAADITALYPEQPSATAQALYNDANTNGGGFVPTKGQWVAVLAQTGPGVQDIIIQIRLTCQRFEGLTPGYWKNHLSAWHDYSPTQTVSSVFSEAPASLGSFTLQQALSFKGGSSLDGAKRILLRAAVAALLNSADPDIHYPLSTSEIVNRVNNALDSNSRVQILFLALQLDIYNNLGAS